MAWEVFVPDSFSSGGEPLIINNILYLVSIRKGGDLESTIFGYDVSTGINKFIKEFPRVDNQSVALDIIERYNIIIDDDKAILVLLATRGGKEIMLLNTEDGRAKWTTQLNTFPVLSGIEVNAWERIGVSHIILKGDQDLYTINAESGDIISEKRFDNRFNIWGWGSNVLQVVDKEITLWDPMGKKVWTYMSDSKNAGLSFIYPDTAYQLNNKNFSTPSAIIGSENGTLRAFNLNGGWFNWNVLRWSVIVGSATTNVWTHNLRAFCLTDQDSLFTFDINSGKKINSIRLDQDNYSLYYLDKSNNVMILANEEFIIGVDPFNGDQLWKIKEPKEEGRQIRPIDNNLFVIRPISEDSIITINNYSRNSGNLMWNEILDRKKLMDKRVAMGGGLMGMDFEVHPALFYYLIEINDLPYLITEHSIKEIDVSLHHESSSIEPSLIKLYLARAFYVENNIHSAISEYTDLVQHYDQMNKDGHRELASLYREAGMNQEAANSMLGYYNLLLPNSQEAHATINQLKEITPLSWIQNTYVSDKKKYLLSDKNKIFQLSSDKIEIYRTNSGALLNSIDLDDNIDEIMHANVQDENSIIVIVRLELEGKPGWGDGEMDFAAWRRDKTQYNLIIINKSSGQVILNKGLQVPSDHDIMGLSLKQNNILINSVFNEVLYIWDYNTVGGKQEWSRTFDVSSYYHLQNNLQNLFYKDMVLVALDDKIVYLDSSTGETEKEFIAADVEEIVVFNEVGLINERLTFIIEDIDYEYITLDLGNNTVLSRGAWESEDPNISEIIEDCFFEITPMGFVASHCFIGENGAIENNWSIDLNWVPNYLGTFNSSLVLLDQTNNEIVGIDIQSGKQKNVIPILWPSSKFDMKNNNIILQTDRKLFVFTI